MALAEAYTALGRPADALAVWQRVLAQHTYARARVQYAELLLKQNQRDTARAALQEVVADDAHAPAFQRRRESVWVHRARTLLRQVT